MIETVILEDIEQTFAISPSSLFPGMTNVSKLVLLYPETY